jgi:uncharacterized membrane protein
MSISLANIVSRPKAVPILRVNNLGLVIFSVAFIALDVALPWLAHQFHVAGPVFLPMHLLVFTAALLFGWRVGLTVGLLTPLVSFSLSGMPLLSVLPLVTMEIASYGLFAGLLREKFRLNLLPALILAMFMGRVALGLTVLLLGLPVSPVEHVFSVTVTGFWGILIQIALVPPLVKLLYFQVKKED